MVSDPNYVRFLLLHSQLCAAAARRDGAEVVRIADGHIQSGAATTVIVSLPKEWRRDTAVEESVTVGRRK